MSIVKRKLIKGGLDLENFTPVTASIGGVLIGLSAVMLMGLNGRIAGISGVFSGTVFGDQGDKFWRILFVAGLIGAPVIYTFASRETLAFEITSNTWLIVAGGVFVGFGTRLGSGCTSGHGVCGLSRLSVRSMVSVALFMAAGMATVAVAKTMVGA